MEKEKRCCGRRGQRDGKKMKSVEECWGGRSGGNGHYREERKMEKWKGMVEEMDRKRRVKRVFRIPYPVMSEIAQQLEPSRTD